MKTFNYYFFTVFVVMGLTGCATTPKEPVKPPVTISDDDIAAGFRIVDTPQGAVLKFNNSLLFDTGKAELSDRSANILQRIANLAREKDMKELVISGHTDNQGSEQLNQKLSEQRADAVKKELERLGLRGERIKANGYGFTRPEASNDKPEGRALNRRAEILFPNFSKKALGGETVEKGFKSDVSRLIDGIAGVVNKGVDLIKKAFGSKD